MFNDRAQIRVVAGRGGDGGLSFRREKHVPRGGPDGGDGGRGGDIVLVADASLRDLSVLRGKVVHQAGRGGHGGGGRRHGADGDGIELRLPVGTQAVDAGELLVDLVDADFRAVVARGGIGGRGNARFATPTRQTPRFAEIGLPGEELELELRLKLLADAALAGLPNAGKSSLLSRISNARPKVAAYPFTTLVPVLGTVDGPDGRQLTVADVPGLIEGASAGLGLGHEFLAHLERAQLLVHVIDASEGDADERFAVVDRELALYGSGLEERHQLVVLNKADLTPEPACFSVVDPRIVGVLRASCATGSGVSEVVHELFRLSPATVPAADTGDAELPTFLEYRPRPARRRAYRILRTDRGLRVVGEAPPEPELEQALREAGARRGTIVEIGEEELEWVP
jgi:GTP-binding protein